MNPEDVRYLVQQGEGDRLEFKEQRTLARDLAKVFVAFANHQGGTVLVGVTDEGQIVGVQDWPALEGKIRNATLNNCRPPMQVRIERAETPEGTVIVVRVPEGMEKPYRAGNIYYVRDGLHSRGATPLELTQMLYQSERFAYDQTPVTEARVEEIVEGGAAFVHHNARTLALMEGVYRHDLPEYPEGAIREVFTNAVMHRDYRSPEWITLRMFDGRLEVENPGGLVGVLSIEELLARPRSYPRNGLLLRVAQDLGLVELVASGIQRIITEVRESGSDVDPVFWADAGRFTVTLPSLWWQMEGTEEI